MAHAIAPGANILVVEATSQTPQELQDLLNAVNTARNTAGVTVISMSWGFTEMSNEASYDSYFTTRGARGNHIHRRQWRHRNRRVSSASPKYSRWGDHAQPE